MTKFLSHWIHPSTPPPASATAHDAPHALLAWLAPAKRSRSSRQQRPEIIQVRVTLNGWDHKAYWTRSEARWSDARFKTVQEEEQALPTGAQAMLQRFLDCRRTLQEDGWTEVFTPSMALFPSDIHPYRHKTPLECRLDEVMLLVEAQRLEEALTALQQCHAQADDWYFHTVARRLFANRARSEHAQAHEDWERAAAHAQRLLQLAQGQDLYALEPYGFGDTFQTANRQVALAATTLAEYALERRHDPEAALAAVEIGEATSHSNDTLMALKTRALWQLGRQQEAFHTHRLWRLDVAQVRDHPAYQAWTLAQDQQAQDTRTDRRRQLQFERTEGPPASPQEEQVLRTQWGALPAAYERWIRQSADHTLTIRDGDQTHVCTRFNASQALAMHAEMLHWIHLHDSLNPDLAQIIHQAITDSGIDPATMLPVAGDPDGCSAFVMQTQGTQAGAVFFWTHDECTVFSPVAQQADHLWDQLTEQAQQSDEVFWA